MITEERGKVVRTETSRKAEKEKKRESLFIVFITGTFPSAVAAVKWHVWVVWLLSRPLPFPVRMFVTRLHSPM